MDWRLLLLAGVAKHYGYYGFPAEWQFDIKNIVSSVLSVLVLTILAWKWKQLVPVALWWIFEEALTITCSTLWITIGPWPIENGQDQCSALVGFDLSSIGLLMIGGIIVWQLRPTTGK